MRKIDSFESEYTVRSDAVNSADVLQALAGGLSHEFNNNLFIFHGYLQLLMQTAQPSDLKALATMRLTLERTRALVSQVASYAKNHATHMRPVDLMAILKSVVHKMSQTGNSQATMNIHTFTGALDVLGDETLLKRAIYEVLTNARQAIDSEQGSVDIYPSLQKISLQTPEFGRDGGEEVQAEFCCIEVTDTGHGMHRAVLERAFEPFFTTKQVGSGSGLGLPAVKGIIESHGGFCEISAKPESGTQFRFYIPAFRGGV